MTPTSALVRKPQGPQRSKRENDVLLLFVFIVCIFLAGGRPCTDFLFLFFFLAGGRTCLDFLFLIFFYFFLSFKMEPKVNLLLPVVIVCIFVAGGRSCSGFLLLFVFFLQVAARALAFCYCLYFCCSWPLVL